MVTTIVLFTCVLDAKKAYNSFCKSRILCLFAFNTTDVLIEPVLDGLIGGERTTSSSASLN